MQTQQLPTTPMTFEKEDPMQIDNDNSLSLFEISPQQKTSDAMYMSLPNEYSFVWRTFLLFSQRHVILMFFARDWTITSWGRCFCFTNTAEVLPNASCRAFHFMLLTFDALIHILLPLNGNVSTKIQYFMEITHFNATSLYI